MRVFITGIGIWCSLGRNVEQFETGLRSGRSGERDIRRFDVSDQSYRCRRAAVLFEEETLRPIIDETYIADLTLSVAQDAFADARLSISDIDPKRTGMSLGTSHGGNIAYMKFMRGRLGLHGGQVDHALTLSVTPTILGQVAKRFGIQGPTVTISTACASGTNSVGRAAELIRSGRASVMLAGGADLFTELSFSGFNILGALARNKCRPLDRDRDGIMLGDGAAMMILESEDRARGRLANIYAEVAGHSIAIEAYHPTSPRPDGSAAARVMKQALAAAGKCPEDIDYINVHGTGTPNNDEAELRAIEQVFGPHAKNVYLSSTKSMVGHTLGAAGSIELAATVLGIAHGFVPPSINLEHPIVGYEDWNYVRNQAKLTQIRAAMSNSFGFSGNLSTIVVTRAEERA